MFSLMLLVLVLDRLALALSMHKHASGPYSRFRVMITLMEDMME